MEEISDSERLPRLPHDADVEVAATFLTTLFEPSELILFRPIETWVDAEKKRNRVDYRNTCYSRCEPTHLRTALRKLLDLSANERTNIFFGICPRLGDGGSFDLAWQIRTVRALWSDIDHVTADDARARIAQSGLPIPSIIVNSGNGVHCYWLLSEPDLIDDAGPPPSVGTEWVESARGTKTPRKYIVEDGENVYLEQRRHVSRLSPKAEHMQDVLAGIATLIGGDHTTDLSRLLRVPGTLNRKDEKNGRTPVPCFIVECEPTRRYSLADFEAFAVPSPETSRAKWIASMPLPKVHRPSVSKENKLNELVAISSIASPGERSEADFSLCCYAIKAGIEKEAVWASVEQIGKFAEQGRSYFDVTWENAELEVRTTKFEEVQKKAAVPIPQRSLAPKATNFSVADHSQDEVASIPTIVVDPATMPVGQILHEITSRLVATRTCFCRAEQLVVVQGERFRSILATPELAGLLNEHVEFYYLDDDAATYKPLTAAYATTWLNQHAEQRRFPIIKLFTRNPVYTDDWRKVAPGYESTSGIYYAGPAVEARDGTEHLDRLLRDFCFKRPADRTNYIGMLLTALLVTRFIGSKPAALFNGNQPELGKSILAQIIAILRDGQAAETATFNPNDEEFAKRLGAIVKSGATTIIIDNAKNRGRNARIESACLERSITDPILSFRLLGYSDSIRAENSHIFCITANSANISPDLVKRSVVINLFHEGDPTKREFQIEDPEGYAHEYREALLGELIGMIERWKAQGSPLAKTQTRFNKRGWGNIIGGILEANGEPDFFANAEEAATTLDETRLDFAELVSQLVEHPRGTWTAGELVEHCRSQKLLAQELGDGSEKSVATKFGILASRFLNEPFSLFDGREAKFQKTEGRKSSVYRVYVLDKVPDLRAVAGRMPHLEDEQGPAP